MFSFAALKAKNDHVLLGREVVLFVSRKCFFGNSAVSTRTYPFTENFPSISGIPSQKRVHVCECTQATGTLV